MKVRISSSLFFNWLIRVSVFASTCVVSLVLAGIAPAASPILYEIHRSIPSSVTTGVCGVPNSHPCFTYTLDGTVLTDGTFGLSRDNPFLSISLTMSDGTNSVVLQQSNYDLGATPMIGASESFLGIGYPYAIRFSDILATSSWTFCSGFRADCHESASLGSNGVDLFARMLDPAVAGVGTVFATAVVVPEPQMGLFIGLGLAGLAGRRTAHPNKCVSDHS
jgi:hypothetical protein